MANLSLDDIGLGSTPRTVIYAISALPFVGFVIGMNYAVRRNQATRKFGRRLIRYAILVHVVYTFCVCPVAGYVALQ